MRRPLAQADRRARYSDLSSSTASRARPYPIRGGVAGGRLHVLRCLSWALILAEPSGAPPGIVGATWGSDAGTKGGDARLMGSLRVAVAGAVSAGCVLPRGWSEPARTSNSTNTGRCFRRSPAGLSPAHGRARRPCPGEVPAATAVPAVPRDHGPAGHDGHGALRPAAGAAHNARQPAPRPGRSAAASASRPGPSRVTLLGDAIHAMSP